MEVGGVVCVLRIRSEVLGLPAMSAHTFKASTQEAELQKPRGKVSTFRELPRTVELDGLGLCFNFSRWCCLRAKFYSLNGTSATESVVLRSGSLYQ